MAKLGFTFEEHTGFLLKGSQVVVVDEIRNSVQAPSEYIGTIGLSRHLTPVIYPVWVHLSPKGRLPNVGEVGELTIIVEEDHVDWAVGVFK